jgi:hypothetical protein
MYTSLTALPKSNLTYPNSTWLSPNTSGGHVTHAGGCQEGSDGFDILSKFVDSLNFGEMFFGIVTQRPLFPQVS